MIVCLSSSSREVALGEGWSWLEVGSREKMDALVGWGVRSVEWVATKQIACAGGRFCEPNICLNRVNPKQKMYRKTG